MAYLGHRGRLPVNAVSRLHGEGKQKSFLRNLFPRWPIYKESSCGGHVTNGVHMAVLGFQRFADELWTRHVARIDWRGGIGKTRCTYFYRSR